ncbi:MAG: aspartate carbamoyltransferase catalytic subunit [Bdellovibrionales bacterium]|nr:aspartate carbamoyltransferase catalytic subunit [Bdellovibrionales bacterium]
MSFSGKSLLRIQDLDIDKVMLLFDKARALKAEFKRSKTFGRKLHLSLESQQKLLAMVFLEPSTRTRMSFQAAAARLGFRVVSFDCSSASSMEKGENEIDTLKNVSALLPDLMVVRYGESKQVGDLLPKLNCPVINAGSGMDEHPSQALLDAFTMLEAKGSLVGQRLLMVGDIRHSRVAHSNLRLLGPLGVQLGICGPSELLPPLEGEWKNVERFEDLQSGISWCQILMGLRIQKERHLAAGSGRDLVSYQGQFRIEPSHLSKWTQNGIILHPGPVIRGVEFAEEILHDPRSLVIEQVTNGLFVRAALYSLILGLEV